MHINLTTNLICNHPGRPQLPPIYEYLCTLMHSPLSLFPSGLGDLTLQTSASDHIIQENGRLEKSFWHIKNNQKNSETSLTECDFVV